MTPRVTPEASPMTDEEIIKALRAAHACCSAREVAAVRSLVITARAEGRAEERERCANIAERAQPPWLNNGYEHAKRDIAAAIRRGPVE